MMWGIIFFVSKDNEGLNAMLDQQEGEDGEPELCEHISTMTKFYIGDICWVISHEEYMDFVIPIIERRRLNWGEITRGGETVEFLSGDAFGAGWAQDSGVLGVMRFDDLEPEYQKRAERDVKGGYVVIFESKARGVEELTHMELMAKGFWGKRRENPNLIIDTTKIAQTLTCAEALEWLEGALHDLDNDNLDPDAAMIAILEKEWKTEDELLEFFKQISIELAMTATQSNYQSTASLFGVDLPYSLGFNSVYQKLWEKAFHTNSQKFKEQISFDKWQNTCIDSGLEWLLVSSLIPLATLYEKPLFEQLRRKSIKSLTPEQEIFLSDLVDSMGSGAYYDGEMMPEELANIPSSKILVEIFCEWRPLQDLWVPDVIRKLLESDYVNNEIKGSISSRLKCEQIDEDLLEDWQSHLEEEWTSEDIEQVLTSCN